MRKLFLATIALTALVGPALAVDLNNAQLSNVGINNNAGGLTNASSISGTRLAANTSVVSNFGAGVNQNPAGNGGLGGTTNGFAQTTVLQGSSNAFQNQALSGAGTITGTYASQQLTGLNSPTGMTQNGSTTTLNANGRLDGSFSIGAQSAANTGMSGYSGSQLVGPGSVSNAVNGNALVVSGAVNGGAAIRQ